MPDNNENLNIELIEQLRTCSLEEYRLQPIPSKMDKIVLVTLNKILALSLTKLEELIHWLKHDDQARATLAEFSKRMASHGVRIRSPHTLKMGLATLCLSNIPPTSEDPDMITIFSFYHHGSKKINYNADRLFIETAMAFGADIIKRLYGRHVKIRTMKKAILAPACEALVAFSQRKTNAQTLSSMGYQEGTGLGGFLFVPREPGQYPAPIEPPPAFIPIETRVQSRSFVPISPEEKSASFVPQNAEELPKTE